LRSIKVSSTISRFLTVITLCLSICSFFNSAYGKPTSTNEPQPVVSIIIDDIGVHKSHGQQVLNVDADLTFAFLPFELHTQDLLQQAQKLDREVMLHMPMESIARIRRNKGVLKRDMDEHLFKSMFNKSLNAIPGLVGINNHRGSLLTQDTRAMNWIMRELKQRDLFFIDSKTTAASVAGDVANQMGLPNLSRHIFLDHNQSEEYIADQFDKLIKRAKRTGWAIAIGHPHPETIAVLQNQIPLLDKHNIKLVRISDLVNQKYQSDTLQLTNNTEQKTAAN